MTGNHCKRKARTTTFLFLCKREEKETYLSQPNKQKLRNISKNPHVMLGLETEDRGDDAVMIPPFPRLCLPMLPSMAPILRNWGGQRRGWQRLLRWPFGLRLRSFSSLGLLKGHVVMAFPLFTDGGLADGLLLSASGTVLPSKGSPGHEEAGTKPRSGQETYPFMRYR